MTLKDQFTLKRVLFTLKRGLVIFKRDISTLERDLIDTERPIHVQALHTKLDQILHRFSTPDSAGELTTE